MVEAPVQLAPPSVAIAPGSIEAYLDADDSDCEAELEAGTGSCSLLARSAGTHAIEVLYRGTANTLPASMTAYATVARAATAPTVQFEPPSPRYGAPVTATVELTTGVDPSIAVPGGTVEVTVVGDSCTITLPATGCELLPAQAGTSTPGAAYSGDANFSPGTGHTSLQVLPAETGLDVLPAQGTVAVGQPLEVSIALQHDVPAHLPQPAGVVSVQDDAGAHCTIMLPDTGCVLQPLVAGQRTVTASYEGDGNFAAASASVAVEVVEAAPVIFGDGFESID